MNTSQKIYDHAARDLGLKETPGRASTPRIALAIASAASWLDPDDSQTAWCGCIRGLWGLETGTGVPPQHYRARHWLDWGREVSRQEAEQGDTVVLRRTGGHHVGLLDCLSPDGRWIYILGGNQNNATNVQKYDTGLIEGIRRG